MLVALIWLAGAFIWLTAMALWVTLILILRFVGWVCQMIANEWDRRHPPEPVWTGSPVDEHSRDFRYL